MRLTFTVTDEATGESKSVACTASKEAIYSAQDSLWIALRRRLWDHAEREGMEDFFDRDRQKADKLGSMAQSLIPIGYEEAGAKPFEALSDQITTTGRNMMDSLAAQKERFLSAHVDKADTHGLMEYPLCYSHDKPANSPHSGDRVIEMTQLIALVPNYVFGRDDLLPPEDAKWHPHVVLTYTLHIQDQRPHLMPK